jgi:hypothetical protein
VKLTPDEAADLYRSGKSSCEIAQFHKLTRNGVEARIRAGGISGGVVWCPVRRIHEELHWTNAEAVSLMAVREKNNQWRQPTLKAS